jgi:heptosyltransferase-2
MGQKNHILIVKHGALGDVVRTSYFAGALRLKFGSDLRLSWVTSAPSKCLLEHNPHIDDLWTSFEPAGEHSFDRVFSLDDEMDVASSVMRLTARQISGAYLAEEQRRYTDDVAEWFDMGLLSRHGKERADELKKQNRRSHGEIFCSIFGVSEIRPEFFLPESYRASAQEYLQGSTGPRVGINPYAGGRWPAKELPTTEYRNLLQALCGRNSVLGRDAQVVLFGSGEDRTRNLKMLEETGHVALVPNTDRSILELAGLISQLDYLITSDSLAMHLAIAQGVRCLAFFAPTSAPEIDSFGLCEKIHSTARDYCSYAKNADNSSITAVRILSAMSGHRPQLFVRNLGSQS